MAGISGLDRAAMELERLDRRKARNGNTGTKRERSISPPMTSRPSKASKVQHNTNDGNQRVNKEDGNTLSDSQKSKLVEVVNLVDSSSPAPVNRQKSPPKAVHVQASHTSQMKEGTMTLESRDITRPHSLQYPHGVVKKTWAFGHERTADDVKIEEVIEKDSVKTALLSAFQWDVHWILSKFNLKQTKFIFAMQAKDEETKSQYREETEYMHKILRFCFPPMDGNVNCMHSKLMLLFHPHKLRIVVPSANLLNFDWGETGIMENSVFMIDLPRLDEDDRDESRDMPSFGQELLHFLEKMRCDEDIQKGVLKFDFSAAKNFAFVHSVGGASYGEDMERTGFAGLSKAVRDLSLATGKELQVDFTASSIGSLNDEFLKNIHSAARGEVAPAAPAKTTSRTAPKPFQKATTPKNIRDIFRIYFPTHDTVAASTGGTQNGGTVCLQRKWWEGNNTFPRSCFRDYRSTRTGLLSHNKILYARGTNVDKKPVAWAYVGSANMSESAWGKLSWDRTQKAWKMACRNWECGVLIPVPQEKLQHGVSAPEDVETESEDEDGDMGNSNTGEVVGMDVFSEVVNVPFEYPGKEFGAREPWYFMEA